MPRLADFGLARSEACETRLTREGMVLGTPGFLAPEQAGLDPALGVVGPATDIHGLGATLYYLLAGRPPHEGESLMAILVSVAKSEPALPDTVPDELARILRRALDPDPDARFETAEPSLKWLERATFVGKATRAPDGVAIGFHEVL